MMLYKRPTFTCPTNGKGTEKQWDLAFLSKEEFQTKYKVSEKEYDRLAGK